MSEPEKLPVCGVCGELPMGGGAAVFCMTRGCGMRGAVLDEADWRRLMDRPRLAPEHLERLKQAVSWMCPSDHITGFDDLGDSIRAALAALGEE